ncbi:nitrate/nitrite transporter NrtS [Paraglaciecola arctica]|uniref:nitrate/nitrite transporter NrtS n=1 Tax=Paraglaciecola arctica TaxID=1128911 RepID=UPI001C072A48|nr:nitrate/nitrite transporter NrtS [Paraglaciecola arctica]
MPLKRKPKWLAIVFRQDILIRSTKIALVVGTVLAMLNHGDKIIDHQLTLIDIYKMLVTYLVPFCVSTYSSVQNELSHYN